MKITFQNKKKQIGKIETSVVAGWLLTVKLPKMFFSVLMKILKIEEMHVKFHLNEPLCFWREFCNFKIFIVEVSYRWTHQTVDLRQIELVTKRIQLVV